jgi:hypothetical protein
MSYVFLVTNYTDRIPAIADLISAAIEEEEISLVPILSKGGDVVHRWDGTEEGSVAHVERFAEENGLDGIVVFKANHGKNYVLGDVSRLVEEVLTNQDQNVSHQDCCYCGFLTMTSVTEDIWYEDENLGDVWVLSFNTESG